MISDKKDFRKRSIIEDKEGHYRMLKMSIFQKK